MSVACSDSSGAVSNWCATKGWDKTRQRALYQPFIMIMQIVALVHPALRRVSSARSAFNQRLNLYVPAGLIGTMIGFALFHRMTGRQFHIAVNTLLVMSGAGLLV